MRIAILASGSRGDVEPYVALGVGLQEAGHVVRLVTHEDFRALVTGHGLSFWPVKGRVQEIAQSDAMRERIEDGYSTSVIPVPPDWGGRIHVTGYWFLDPPADWAPPPELVAFLQAGPPPVYVGFGSMSSRDPERTADLVLQALGRTQQRAITLAGWGGLRAADLPESVFMIDSVPFSWLFPRVVAVVHHGGAGTTAAGLRAGVPSVVVPFFGDQPYWGQRVAQLGVGPEPIPRRSLTLERLAQAIQMAVTDREMRGRAASLGSKIQAEDGVARAVAVVGQLNARCA